MSDLAERLRICTGFVFLAEHPDLIGVMKEAADRIEYLESVAGAVSQGEQTYDDRGNLVRVPPVDPYAKRQRDG